MRFFHFLLLFVMTVIFIAANVEQALISSDIEIQIQNQQNVSLREALNILEKVYHIHVVYEEVLVEGK